jgi:hypothetical protein
MLSNAPPRRAGKGYRWERRDGCDCTACPWRGRCLGHRWPNWIEVKL